ncbi:hypothetical protein LPJ62_004796, partial [Coemansia sp. RSA 2167]
CRHPHRPSVVLIAARRPAVPPDCRGRQAVSDRSGVDQWHVFERTADPRAAVRGAAIRRRNQARIQLARVCAVAGV